MQIRIHNQIRNSKHIDTLQETACLKPGSKITSIIFIVCFILLTGGRYWYRTSRLNLHLEGPKRASKLATKLSLTRELYSDCFPPLG